MKIRFILVVIKEMLLSSSFRRFLAGIMAIFDEVPEDPEDYVEKNSATHSINTFSMVGFLYIGVFVSVHFNFSFSSLMVLGIMPLSPLGGCWERL